MVRHNSRTKAHEIVTHHRSIVARGSTSIHYSLYSGAGPRRYGGVSLRFWLLPSRGALRTVRLALRRRRLLDLALGDVPMLIGLGLSGLVGRVSDFLGRVLVVLPEGGAR